MKIRKLFILFLLMYFVLVSGSRQVPGTFNFENSIPITQETNF